MVEAKVSKLREYFTETTHHRQTEPTDLSGVKLFVGNMRAESSQRKDSPIRLNDTYRSNFVLGNDRESCFEEEAGGPAESKHRSRSSVASVKNVIVDQQKIQLQQYKDHTRCI